MKRDLPQEAQPMLLRPIDIKRQARIPYRTVIDWLEVGHPRAGVLPSVNLSASAKRKSYRIKAEDWEEFLTRLQTEPRTERPASPVPRSAAEPKSDGMFSY